MTREHQIDFEFPEERVRRDEDSAGGGGRAGGGGNADAGPDTNDRDREREERDRREIPGLSDKEARVLRVVGAFRTIDGDHLPRRAVESLVRQGLATRDRAYLRLNEPSRVIVALTKKGARLARADRSPAERQRYYAGMVKPRELRHDLEIYPAAVKEIKAIEDRGGHLTRVVIDHEMKSIMAKRMNTPGEETMESRREAVARELELPIVEGHLKIPDVRIEYEDIDGHERHLDLEITTEKYRGKMMSAKTKAGFKLSGVRDSSGPRGKVRDDHHQNFF